LGGEKGRGWRREVRAEKADSGERRKALSMEGRRAVRSSGVRNRLKKS